MVGLIQSATLREAAIAFREPSIRHILLAGPPGVGKTTFSFMIAEIMKLPAWKYQFHAESTPSEMVGMYVPAENTFRWESGPLDQAYTQGGVFIMDEIVEASGPCKTFLYGALDAGHGGTISYVGRTFTPSPTYKAIGTMNGLPYDGGLPEALLDRFDATFLILKPGEKQLLTLDSDLRELCEDAYETAKDPLMGPEITFRMIRAVQNLRRVLKLDQAVLSAMHGNEKLAGSFLEALALTSPPSTLVPVPTLASIDPSGGALVTEEIEDDTQAESLIGDDDGGDDDDDDDDDDGGDDDDDDDDDEEDEPDVDDDDDEEWDA